MRKTSRMIAGLAVTSMIGASGALAWAASASGAAGKSPARPAGTSYVAETAGDGGVGLIVSRDLHQVRFATIAYRQKCSDGDTVYDYASLSRIPMAANRTFRYSFRSDPQPSTAVPGATYSYTQLIKGRMNKLGTRIIGTARFTDTLTNPAGASFTCDTGTIAFRAAD